MEEKGKGKTGERGKNVGRGETVSARQKENMYTKEEVSR
jgi:hypothetical protein